MRLVPRLRRHTSDPEDPEPLTRLRRRFVIGAVASAVAFAMAFVFDLVRHSSSDDMVVSGVERAATGIGVLCGLAALMLWGLTLSAEHALSIWKVASRSTTQAQTDDGRPSAGATRRAPTQPIPISRGREIRRSHHDRHAV